MPATSQRRAIGIVRVSQVNGRDGESFASPGEQRDRISAACERDGLRLLEVVEELDVSGGKPLDERAGLRQAVEAIEAGQFDVLAAGYFDRLFRSLRVQAEVVERVEAAGGQVLAVDVGRVTNGSAGQWLSGTMLGAVSEYQRRTAAERSAEAQQRAITRGVAPWPRVSPGYLRGDDGRLVRDPATADTVANAFAMRATGAPLAEIRGFLRDHGISRSHHSVGDLLKSRTVLGELHYGHYTPNLSAHPAIVERDVWQAVQRVSVPRGRHAKSERLLARLGVLRCSSCGARLVVSTSNHGTHANYRCPTTNDCTQRVAISAVMVEKIVVDKVRKVLTDAEGRASVETNAVQAQHEHERAQEALDAAVRSFAAAGVMDEPSAVERLSGLRAERDAARDAVDRLGGQHAAVTVSAAADWDRLSLDARRGLIRATVDRVEVFPFRGRPRHLPRVAVHLVGE